MCTEKQGLKVEVNLSFEEFRERNLHRLYWPKRADIIYMLPYVGILLTYTVLLIIGKRVLEKLIFWGILLALQPLAMQIGAKRLYKRTHGKSYTISEDGVICEKGTTEASLRYKWKEIRKVEEYEAGFIFYFSFADFESPFIIPKRCFVDEGELQTLRELLERNVKRSRLKIKVTA